ncbi:shikimate kinase [Ohtaekwangia koreensis]|uniref:Shikimate kinase n=1 Tax=Ohtaekwangia koreensis TaxID=688867 RepID=A0A1T5ILI1_9BACT|nr:shikimate kinase [Ohtaekwangia koreensis]SKC39823.1 shikimate kinase [Ohtaekwangia koreensis]
MKIYLIGMPGSGKSTLGKPLASELGIPFVDQDKEIEDREGKTVKEIFASLGEDHFRQTEAQVLREWAGSEKSFVMATGGGSPCFYNGIEIIRQSGLSIFIDVSVAELLKRVGANKDRPLLHANDLKEKEERLAGLYEKRLPIYQQAHVILHHPTLKSLLEVIQLRK